MTCISGVAASPWMGAKRARSGADGCRVNLVSSPDCRNAFHVSCEALSLALGHSILVIGGYVAQLLSRGSTILVCVQALPSAAAKLAALLVAGNVASDVVLFLLG